MVTNFARELDGIGHAPRAKAWIGVEWSRERFLLFVVPPEVEVRRTCKHSGKSIDQGDGLAMKTEKWGDEHDALYAIAILGHPSSGDGAARKTDERNTISKSGCYVETNGCLVEKILPGLQSLDGIHTVSESGIAGARQDDVGSGCMKNACQGKELLRAIREAVKENEGAFGFVSVAEQATSSLGGER